ncbi:hypothetical protein L9F63_008273, partial [Diploptera punctata]
SQGIYEIPCTSCEQTYVGRTNRRISCRIQEHKAAINRQEPTSTLTLAKIDHEKSRIYREAIEIEKRPHIMNTRDDAQRLPSTWKTALAAHHVIPRTAKKIRRKQRLGNIERGRRLDGFLPIQLHYPTVKIYRDRVSNLILFRKEQSLNGLMAAMGINYKSVEWRLFVSSKIILKCVLLHNGNIVTIVSDWGCT